MKISGIVYDITGSYDTAFYFGGLVLLVAGLISATIPFVTKKDADTAGVYKIAKTRYI